MNTPPRGSTAARDAEPAPPPKAPTALRAYTPYEVVPIDLRIGGQRYRTVAMAHYDTPDGRRAYHLALWPPLPEGARTGWYWWSPATMTRRHFAR
ncbi:hypothetical protein [Streptomyces sp. TLI_146]|uniref:hypothetical protein n=1 Tax=Streptomyces sp. TLI_146 TaxID=1938858 RepID=UPI000C711112|nr:hypothetical protein [Streptomyces sp. TLI_146]PKV84209.1 hypothetical protein BX283_1720 [Streptomyces sp. TLI_146]